MTSRRICLAALLLVVHGACRERSPLPAADLKWTEADRARPAAKLLDEFWAKVETDGAITVTYPSERLEVPFLRNFAGQGMRLDPLRIGFEGTVVTIQGQDVSPSILREDLTLYVQTCEATESFGGALLEPGEGTTGGDLFPILDLLVEHGIYLQQKMDMGSTQQVEKRPAPASPEAVVKTIVTTAESPVTVPLVGLQIDIDEKGQFHVAGAARSLQELERILIEHVAKDGPPPVAVAASDEAPHDRFTAFINLLAKHGVKDVTLKGFVGP